MAQSASKPRRPEKIRRSVSLDRRASAPGVKKRNKLHEIQVVPVKNAEVLFLHATNDPNDERDDGAPRGTLETMSRAGPDRTGRMEYEERDDGFLLTVYTEELIKLTMKLFKQSMRTNTVGNASFEREKNSSAACVIHSSRAARAPLALSPRSSPAQFCCNQHEDCASLTCYMRTSVYLKFIRPVNPPRPNRTCTKKGHCAKNI